MNNAKKKLSAATALFLSLLFLLTSCATTSSESSELPESMDAQESSSAELESWSPTYKTAVSIGKTYEAPEADSAYPDTFGSELTDGLYAEGDKGYVDPRWQSFLKPDPIEIIIDLGEDGKLLYCFEVSYLHDIGPGIATPQNLFVSSSDDNESWSVLCTYPTSLDSETGAYKASMELDEPINARYIKFTMSHYSAHIFLDELSVYADIPGAGSSENVLANVKQAYDDDSYDYTSALTSLSTGKTDFSLEKILVSAGASYTSSASASSKYPDTARLLTDGSPLGAIYESGKWVGYEESGEMSITMTLGQKTHISHFEVSAFINETLGILLPTYIDVYIETGSDFTKIGRMYAPVTDGVYYYNYSLAMRDTVEAKKIKFVFPEQDRSYLMLEEISVYKYDQAVTDDFVSFYSDEPIKKVTDKKYFSSSDSDYSTEINLISGLRQRMFSYFPIDSKIGGNSEETTPLLTDGSYAASADYSATGWCRFGGGQGRDIVYDLGAVASVSRFKVSFLRQDNVGINIISSVLIYLSENGVDWYPVKAAVLPSSEATEILRQEYSLDNPYEARFVRFSFRVWPNAYCDELEAYGTKKITSETKLLSESGIPSSLIDRGAYIERDKHLGGANDIVLLPNYSASDEKNNVENPGYQTEELLPYVAFLDRDGNIKDAMFDGYLFCQTGSMLEGGHYYANANMKEVKDVTDKLFSKGRDLDALEKAVGQLKNELSGYSDYKVQFYFTLAYPGVGVAFGDIDGDGSIDTLNTVEDRIAAVKWAMDDFMTRYNAQSYENIEFAGFYWVHESMTENADDALLINTISDTAHEYGYELFWIPFFKAAGFDQWEHYGFDLACMQPNSAFSASVGDEYIQYCATMAKRLGMCVEMEITEAALSDPIFFNKYMKYLTGGYEYGYMSETVHIYYQDLFDYYLSCYSEDDKARLIYDYTYDFIKGSLNTAPAAQDSSGFESQTGTVLQGTLNSDGSNAREYLLLTSPENGSITLAKNGDFCYYPNKGYNGKDTFTFCIDNYLGISEPTTVTIEIG